MIRFEPVVRATWWPPQLGELLTHVSTWSLVQRVDVVVNSITDGAHDAGSLHPYGLAADLDTEGDRRPDLERLYAWLARHLPHPWQVILETTHVHAEWDVGRRTPSLPPRP